MRLQRPIYCALAISAIAAPAWAAPAGCEAGATASDLQAKISAYATYGAADDPELEQLELRAGAVDRTLACLTEPLTPALAGELHRHRALRYYLQRPPGLGPAVYDLDEAHRLEIGRILDAACVADGARPYRDPVWSTLELSNLAAGRSCVGVKPFVLQRPATELVLLNGAPPDTTLYAGQADRSSPLPLVLQRLDHDGAVLQSAWLDATTPLPPIPPRARQAGPLALLSGGAVAIAAGGALTALSFPAREQWCRWITNDGDYTQRTCDGTEPGFEDDRPAAANALLGAGLGALALGVGLTAGGAVWMQAEPHGVGLTVPLP